MEDGDGNLCRVDRIKPIELERDKLARELFTNAVLVHDEMQALANSLRSKVAAFVKRALSEYDKKLGGTKGNVTLYSFDRKIKIERSRQDRICFNQNLVAAKAMIDDCIKRWSKGSNKNLQAIVQGAFKTDKQGRFSAARVLSLRKHNIDDPQWQQAMKALADAIEVDSSAEYFRVYWRDDNNSYRPLALDLANITTEIPLENANEPATETA
jgi:hypothetical protein